MSRAQMMTPRNRCGVSASEREIDEEAKRGAETERLRKLNTELLAALRDAICWVNLDDQGAPEMIAKWRAIIAKAGG